RAAYEQALSNGSYDSVLRGNGKMERAYAMNNHKEYFAETSEAFFGQNDFYPFTSDELSQHDPRMHRLLASLWSVEDKEGVSANGTTQGSVTEKNATAATTTRKEKQKSRRDQRKLATSGKAASDKAASDTSNDEAKEQRYEVVSPPVSMKLDPFYEKYTDASGYPIVASGSVDDYALKEAAYLVDMMLKERPDLRQAMVDSGSRLIVIGHDEFTTDIPEYAKMRPKDFWDARARGLGGSRQEAVCSCGEENLLAFSGDPYSTENILIHEFAHNIHLRGLVNLDPTFDERLRDTYDSAMGRGLWKGKYASTNPAEYFAEGVQSWFNNNRQPDHDHNHVDTREELREYDSPLAALCKEVFGTTNLVYSKPGTRLKGHLKGYDPASAPKFVWPERLVEAKRKIMEDVKSQGDDRQKVYKN
ncbi:MAG: hypothetical protein ACR2NZ_01140, partial [Rubripirellula sp.]